MHLLVSMEGLETSVWVLIERLECGAAGAIKKVVGNSRFFNGDTRIYGAKPVLLHLGWHKN